jgi:acid stress-induced BolA-like protein IbaG/YrbA
LIGSALPGALVNVRSADNVHYEATVVSPAFAGLRPLQRHKLVYGALGERMGGEIHALALETLTPDELAARGTV